MSTFNRYSSTAPGQCTGGHVQAACTSYEMADAWRWDMYVVQPLDATEFVPAGGTNDSKCGAMCVWRESD